MNDKIIHEDCAQEHPGQSCFESELEDAFCGASPEQVLNIFKMFERWTKDYCKVCGQWNNQYRSHTIHCEHCNCNGMKEIK